MPFKLFELEYEECRIVRRINRFVVEVEVEGRNARAYINNTGRLKELLFEGNIGHCIKKSGGKTSYRLFAARCGENCFALIDTQFQMRGFEKSLERIEWLDCRKFRRNIRVFDSVIDYAFCNRTLLEVKSAAMKVGDYAMYPDCPTERGRKHVRTMMRVAREGRAIITFIAALPSVKAFKPNKHADAELYRLLLHSVKEGVELRAVKIVYADGEVSLEDPDFPVLLI